MRARLARFLRAWAERLHPLPPHICKPAPSAPLVMTLDADTRPFSAAISKCTEQLREFREAADDAFLAGQQALATRPAFTVPKRRRALATATRKPAKTTKGRQR